MVDLRNLRRAIMFEENLSLSDMEELFRVSKDELFDSIKALLLEAKADTALQKRLIERGDIVYGTLSINRNNQCIVNFGEKKYYINAEDIRDGLNEDLVLLDVIDENKNKAKVKTVIERKTGILAVNFINNELIPVSDPFSNKIVLSDEDMSKLELNDRITVKVDKTEGDITYCRLDQKIGKKDDLALEERTIIAKRGGHLGFNNVIQKEVDELIPDELTKKDYIGKVDLRGEQAFTIDDETTQDIDDGLFVKLLQNGHIIVGVPISLVSYFVPIESAIFKEACYRCNSFYEGKHSEPMFHRKICNGIGSLNPNEDRLARTHIVEFDENFNIVNYEQVQSVIRSRLKMTYYDVNNVITRDIVKPEYEPFVGALRILYEISKVLEQRKLERGAIDIKSQEIGITFDNRMQAIGFHSLEHLEARKIIENFALLVNELSHIYASERNILTINRVELPPNLEHFNQMIRELNACGLTLKELEDTQDPKEIARIIKAVQADPRADAFSAKMLKEFPKAFYSIAALGHWGLALLYYMQVTSPIRRIGDFFNNKQFDYYDAGIPSPFTREIAETIAKNASHMEIMADRADQECLNMYMAQYMSNNIGQTFPGMIMDINPSGLIVKTDNHVLGKTNLGNIRIGRYSYNKATGTLLSKHSDERLCLGDNVKVLVNGVSIKNRIVDYDLTEKVEPKRLILR